MRIEKVKEPKPFEPFKIQVTFDSQDDVDIFWSILTDIENAYPNYARVFMQAIADKTMLSSKTKKN